MLFWKKSNYEITTTLYSAVTCIHVGLYIYTGWKTTVCTNGIHNVDCA